MKLPKPFLQVSAALALSAVALLSGCGRKTTGTPSPSTISVGMLAPLTGSGARFGESQRNAVQLAISEINAAGGIDGGKFELIVEDTKSEPPTAVTAFLRLSEQPNILALFGSAASLDVPAYLPRVDTAAIPHILPVAVLPKITEMGSRWTFRTALNDRLAAVKMANFVVSTLNAKKIGVLLEDSAFGETVLNFVAEAKRLGVEPLDIERFRRGDLDIKPQLTKLQSLGVTHVQFWGYYTEYALVAKQMKELGFAATLLGNQAPVNDKTIELGGAAMEGAMNICLFVPTSADERSKQFVAHYRAKYNADPDTWAAQSYDSMYLLADAIKRGGATRQGVRDALAQTRDFSGITGTISFNSKGDAEYRETSIVKVQNGKFVALRDTPQ